jgi:hypothetical protein
MQKLTTIDTQYTLRCLALHESSIICGLIQPYFWLKIDKGVYKPWVRGEIQI